MTGADDPADNAQLGRLRREQEAAGTVAEWEGVTAALEVLEDAVGQLSRRGLLVMAERLGRLNTRALHRLGQEDRRAVRELVKGRP
jgi:hypothetical protein